MKPFKKAFSLLIKLIKWVLLISAIAKSERELEKTRNEKEKYIDMGSGFDPITHAKSDEGSAEERKGYLYKAAGFRRKETTILTKLSWLKIWRAIIALTGLTIIAVISEMAYPNIGRGIQNEYYVTLAQIFPVLLIACYIEKPIMRDTYGRESKMRNFWKFTKQFNGVLIVLIGEVLSLFAIATKTSYTWLLIMSTTSFIYIFKILIDNIRAREA